MTTDTAPVLTFAEADIPKTVGNRKPAPNPFDGVFPRDEKAVQITLEARTPEDEKAITRLSNQARKAAAAVERTGRVQRVDNGNGTVTLSFWTVSKRTRANTLPHQVQSEVSVPTPAPETAPKPAAKKATAKR